MMESDTVPLVLSTLPGSSLALQKSLTPFNCFFVSKKSSFYFSLLVPGSLVANLRSFFPHLFVLVFFSFRHFVPSLFREILPGLFIVCPDVGFGVSFPPHFYLLQPPSVPTVEIPLLVPLRGQDFLFCSRLPSCDLNS